MIRIIMIIQNIKNLVLGVQVGRDKKQGRGRGAPPRPTTGVPIPIKSTLSTARHCLLHHSTEHKTYFKTFVKRK